MVVLLGHLTKCCTISIDAAQSCTIITLIEQNPNTLETHMQPPTPLDTLAELDTAPVAALPVEVSPAAARLIQDSTSANTRRAYRGALARLDVWLAGRALDDAALAAYLGELDEAGKAPATASLTVAAVRFRAKLAGLPDPVGPAADRSHKGFRREGRGERGRGQAPGLDLDAIAEIMAVADRPRRTGRGVESEAGAKRRGAVDRALVGVLFQACLRRSEAAALEWRDIEPASQPDAYRVHVRASKTNQEGAPDVRLVKNGAVRALEAIRPESGEPGASVFGLSAASIGRRFTAAAAAAGYRASAHSARVTYASELTRLGASTTEVMRAGAWKTARMVAHYSAGVRAEDNATAKYL